MSKRLRCRLLVRLTHQLTGLAEEKIEEAHAAQTSLKTTTEGAVNVNEALAATLAAARTSLQNNLEVLDASTARLKDAIVLRDSAERATGKLEAVNKIYVERFGDLSKLMNVAETTSKKLRETTKLCEDKTTKAKRKSDSVHTLLQRLETSTSKSTQAIDDIDERHTLLDKKHNELESLHESVSTKLATVSSLLDNHDAKLNQATDLHKTAVAGADVLAKEMNDVREKVSTTKRDVTTAIKQEKSLPCLRPPEGDRAAFEDKLAPDVRRRRTEGGRADDDRRAHRHRHPATPRAVLLPQVESNDDNDRASNSDNSTSSRDLSAREYMRRLLEELGGDTDHSGLTPLKAPSGSEFNRSDARRRVDHGVFQTTSQDLAPSMNRREALRTSTTHFKGDRGLHSTPFQWRDLNSIPQEIIHEQSRRLTSMWDTWTNKRHGVSGPQVHDALAATDFPTLEAESDEAAFEWYDESASSSIRQNRSPIAESTSRVDIPSGKAEPAAPNDAQ
ncbi:hypothetical protein THAOC_07179, partial [Thalassiosira oceanica]